MGNQNKGSNKTPEQGAEGAISVKDVGDRENSD